MFHGSHVVVTWVSRGVTWEHLGGHPAVAHASALGGQGGAQPELGKLVHLVVTWPLHLGRRSSAPSSEWSPQVLAWSVTQRPQAQACRRAPLLMGPGDPWLGPSCGTCPAFLLDSGLWQGPVSAFLKAQGLKSASRAPFADGAQTGSTVCGRCKRSRPPSHSARSVLVFGPQHVGCPGRGHSLPTAQRPLAFWLPRGGRVQLHASLHLMVTPTSLVR